MSIHDTQKLPGYISGSGKNRTETALSRINAITEDSESLFRSPINTLGKEGRFELHRYIATGAATQEDALRIALISGFRGDQPEGVSASSRFLELTSDDPELIKGIHLFGYPIVNPWGWENRKAWNASGKYIAREFWTESEEAEVYLLERELAVIGFHGVISLHTWARNEFGFFARGEVFREALLKPAVDAANAFLQQHGGSEGIGVTINGPTHVDELLRGNHDLRPHPFELVIHIPQNAPQLTQTLGTVSALAAIINEYRSFIAQAQNI